MNWFYSIKPTWKRKERPSDSRKFAFIYPELDDDADPDLCLIEPSGPAWDAIIKEEVVDGDEVASVALLADALHRE